MFELHCKGPDAWHQEYAEHETQYAALSYSAVIVLCHTYPWQRLIQWLEQHRNMLLNFASSSFAAHSNVSS